MQIPHRVLDAPGITADAVLFYAVLREVGYPANGEPFFATYERLAEQAGWSREGSADSTVRERCRKAWTPLAAAKVLETKRANQAGLTHLRYQLLETPGGFEQLPREVLQILTSDQCTGQASDLTRHYLAYRRAVLTPTSKVARSHDDPVALSTAQIAKATKTGQTKTTALRRQLASLGLIHVHEVSGKAPLVALAPFTPAPARPGSTPLGIPSSPPSESRHHPPRNPVITPLGIPSHVVDVVDGVDVVDEPLVPGRRPVTSVERERETAPGAPAKGGTRDQAWRQAVAIAQGSQQLQQAGREVFYAVASTIAAELRRCEAQGLQRDLAATRRQVVEALAGVEDGDGMGERFVDRTRVALATFHADRKAAPTMEPVGSSASLVAIPEGETLAELAARELVPVTSASNSVEVVRAVTVQLARELLEALDADPWADPDALLPGLRDRVRATLPEHHQLAARWAAGAVSRAVGVDRAWQAWEALQAPDETELDPQVQAEVMASMASVSAVS